MCIRRSLFRALTLVGFMTVALFVVAVVAGPGSVVMAQTAPGKPASPEAASEPLPPGASTQTLLTGMNNPVAMAFDPQGRLFYTEKDTGDVRLFTNGALQGQPVLNLTVDNANEQGLLGITIDPNYNTNRYVYIFYTCAGCNPREHRVARFVFDVNTGQAVPNSLQTIYTIPNDSQCLNHNGGNIHFGPDGKLYVTAGDDGCTPQKSQDLSLKNGKILRINSDGSVPSDGPFGSRTDDGKAIWAYGLRNSFDFTFDTVVSGRIFASENGPSCDDELNRIERGFNYGWRANYPCDDNNPSPQYNTIPPLWYLGTGSPDPVGCCTAPTGVEVYSGAQVPQWQNHLFMCNLKSSGSAGYGTGGLYHFYLNEDRTSVTDFRLVTGVNCTMDIETGPDGALYYMEQAGGGGGNLVKIGGSCDISFQDAPPESTFYQYITCLACQGIIGGYPCGGPGEPCGGFSDPYFRPGANITRGQISKIVSEAAGFSDAPGGQTYEDVPPSNPFYTWISRLSSRGYISGYACGGPGEPCGAGSRPYFRPNASASRGQLSKIVSNAAGFEEAVSGQTYADVPASSNPSSFYSYIERLTLHNAVDGYACGGPGPNSGPCDAQSRPYFRPGNLVTRGQAAKIVSNAFFPNCLTAAD